MATMLHVLHYVKSQNVLHTNSSSQQKLVKEQVTAGCHRTHHKSRSASPIDWL